MVASLLIVGECPVGCGMLGVVVLTSVVTGRLVFFAPCCGVAWPHLPPSDRVDEINSLDGIESGSLMLPSGDELAAIAPQLVVLREEPVESWIDFISRIVPSSGIPS